jgi:hypothetical protein
VVDCDGGQFPEHTLRRLSYRVAQGLTEFVDGGVQAVLDVSTNASLPGERRKRSVNPAHPLFEIALHRFPERSFTPIAVGVRL